MQARHSGAFMLLPITLAALATTAHAGCTKSADRTDAPAESAAPLVSASPAPPAAPSAPAAPRPEALVPLAVLAPRKVLARDIPDGGWSPEFTFQRDAGDEGLTLVAAGARCIEKGLSLCTSAQWRLACEADPSIAAVETWTASIGLQGGFLIPGGGGGCASIKSAPGSGTSPFRAGACCSRAIAIQTSTPPTAVMKSTATKLLGFENALNRKSGLAVRELLDDPVQFYGNTHSRSSAGDFFDTYFRAHPDFWVIHDRCDVTFQKGEDTWTADCRKTSQQDGKMSDTVTRYVWGGRSARIRSISDVFVFREFSEP